MNLFRSLQSRRASLFSILELEQPIPLREQILHNSNPNLKNPLQETPILKIQSKNLANKISLLSFRSKPSAWNKQQMPTSKNPLLILTQKTHIRNPPFSKSQQHPHFQNQHSTHSQAENPNPSSKKDKTHFSKPISYKTQQLKHASKLKQTTTFLQTKRKPPRFWTKSKTHFWKPPFSQSRQYPNRKRARYL